MWTRNSVSGISILDPVCPSVYTQPPTFDPPKCRFFPGAVFWLRQAPIEPYWENPKPGNPIFSAHSTNTSPTLTSWPPDFAASTASFYPVAIGKAAILPTIAPKSRRVRWLSANSSQ
jgi:hypothetical protein